MFLKNVQNGEESTTVNNRQE